MILGQTVWVQREDFVESCLHMDFRESSEEVEGEKAVQEVEVFQNYSSLLLLPNGTFPGRLGVS